MHIRVQKSLMNVLDTLERLKNFLASWPRSYKTTKHCARLSFSIRKPSESFKRWSFICVQALQPEGFRRLMMKLCKLTGHFERTNLSDNLHFSVRDSMGDPGIILKVPELQWTKENAKFTNVTIKSGIEEGRPQSSQHFSNDLCVN